MGLTMPARVRGPFPPGKDLAMATLVKYMRCLMPKDSIISDPDNGDSFPASIHQAYTDPVAGTSIGQ